LALGVQDSHRLEPEADRRACAVILAFLVCLIVHIIIQKRGPFLTPFWEKVKINIVRFLGRLSNRQFPC
jgi:hypothetical protein